MRIREMVPTDALQVAAVHAAAGATAYRDYGQDAVAGWVKEFASPEHIVEQLESCRVGLVALDSADLVVGSVFVGHATRGPDVIGGLYVDGPGRGVGTALLHEALGWLRCAGSAQARAFVMTRNPAAMSFFAHHGFAAGEIVPSVMFGPSGQARTMSLVLAPARGARPEIVVLCGSTRFSEAWAKARYDLTLAGKIVLTIGCDTYSDEGLGIPSEQKAKLDALHLRKIDLADRVLVLNMDGYLGASTKCEIAYANRHGKPVDYLQPEEGVRV